VFIGVHPWLLLCSLALLSAPLRAETTFPITTDPGSGITLKLSTPLTAMPRFGFMPVRFWVENNSQRDGAWQVHFRAGSNVGFPGEVATDLAVAVPAGQSRETWFYVPIAEPGVAATAVAGGTPSLSSMLPTTPPAIPGIYPLARSDRGGPSPITETFRLSGGSSVSSGSISRTFVITQTGPAGLLPNVELSKLPPRTAMSVLPGATPGEVTRIITTTVDVQLPSSFSSGGGSSMSPSTTVMMNARQKLRDAGLQPRSSSSSSSSRTEPGDKPGTNLVTFTLRQTGLAADLPPVPAEKLPPGFTDVDVSPGANPGEVVRTFTYKETVSTAGATAQAPRGLVNISGGGGGGGVVTMPPVAAGSGTTATYTGSGTVGGARGSPSSSGTVSLSGGGGGMTFTSSSGGTSSSSATEAAARQVLANSRLLQTSSRVSLSTNSYPISAGTGQMAWLITFIQTGPASQLPKPPASSLPAGVIVNLHPSSSPGEVVRTITYADPAAYASVMNGSSAGSAMMAGRYELMRYGFLRSQPGVSQGTSSRPSIAGSSMMTMIFTESGPANLLPDVPPSSLPSIPGGNIRVNVTPGAITGEVSRNFIVTFPMPGMGGGIGGMMTAAARALASQPMNIAAEVSGSGLTKPLQLSISSQLPNGQSSTPPIAHTASLEQTLRSKLSLAGLRGSPSLATVDLAALPADWRVWSSFHGVALRESEFTALDPGRRAALRGWLALGGQLFLLPETAGAAKTENVGVGRIRTLTAPLADIDASDLRDQLRLTVLSLSLPERDALKLPEKSPVAIAVSDIVVKNTWLAVFLIGFAIIIGPVNLFAFAPPAKRHRLFLTTPLISLLGAAGLAGAILMQDGTGGDGVRRAVVVLIPGENTAAVFQEQACRTGFLASRNFALDDDVIMSGTTLDAYNPVGRVSTLTRGGGRAEGDWFRNRYAQAHHLRRLIPTRGRVELVGTAPDGAPIVESTLATTLRDFALVGPDGKIWIAADVPTGRRVTLGRETGSRWLVLSGAGGSPHLDDVLAAGAPREPGHWIARGGDSDLAPIATHPGVRWSDTGILYTGVAAAAISAPRTAANGGGE